RIFLSFFFQAEDGIRDFHVTGVQTCALPIYLFFQDFNGPDCLLNHPSICTTIYSLILFYFQFEMKLHYSLYMCVYTNTERVREKIGRASCRERVELVVVRGA